MLLLAIDWATVGVKAGQLILCLSILVILHELGHFIPAKLFGCRVEKFYLFFDPWFSLFKKKVKDTEYGVGWLPLGGYVKISGMIDESMDTEAMKLPPKDYEFRSKKAWQRLIIMLGGIIVNVILAYVIYAMVLMVWGQSKIPLKSMKYGIAFQDSIFQELKFQNGDQLLSVDGKPVEYYEEAGLKIFMASSAKVERDGKEIELKFPVDLLGRLAEKKKKGIVPIMPRVPSIVGSFKELDEKSPAKDAGIKENDVILTVNQQPIKFYDEIKPILSASNGTVQVSYLRGTDTLHSVCKLTADKRMVLPNLYDEEKLDSLGIIKVEKKEYSFFEAIPAAFTLTGSKLMSYLEQFKKILNPKTGAYKGIGGFKAIGSAFSGQWSDWEAFWNLTAFISLILAVMNLLPIPALDGGHVMFTLYEIITGRKPNEKFLEYAQMVGMVILLALMVYANGNDWFGWGK